MARGLPSAYMKLKGLTLKQKWAKYKASGSPRAAGSKPKGKGSVTGAVKKRYGSAPGIVKLADDIADMGILVAAPAARIKELVDYGNWEAFMNGISMDYTGYQPYGPADGVHNTTPGLARMTDAGSWDLKRAQGLKHILTAILRRKHQSTVSKYAPIRRFGKQSMGSLASSGLAKGIAEMPTIIAVKEGQKFPEGRKLLRYAEIQSRFHTGIRHNSSTGDYEGFSLTDLLRSIISSGTGVGIKKGLTMATKGMKFKLPRM